MTTRIIPRQGSHFVHLLMLQPVSFSGSFVLVFYIVAH